MRLPKVGLSLMPDLAFHEASSPLFDANEVEVIEWSFDMCWGSDLPQHCLQLLQAYSSNNNLYGHGVTFSLLTAKRTAQQNVWLEYLADEVKQFNYQKISEHFGFLNTEKFTQGAPLSVPYMPELVEVGINNLKALQKIANVPIGIENLGFAFSREDVIDQGKFMTDLLNAVDGFLLLDIHNIYCNMINFDMTFAEVTATLPLDRVREIHISGGSERTIQYQQKNIYCDSHDAKVPDAVFALLEQHLPNFKDIELCIFERIGNTLHNQYEMSQFREDFKTLKSIINKAHHDSIKQ